MIHQLKQEQFLPISLETAWDFFATPQNLNLITPKELVFEIRSSLPEKIYPGLIISYRIKPMLNVPLEWVTEITHMHASAYFVDEQRKGPFRIWHHEHHFKAVEGGVLMTDLLHYDIGKSVLGWLAGHLFVHRQVKEIFEYRYQLLEKHFKA